MGHPVSENDNTWLEVCSLSLFKDRFERLSRNVHSVTTTQNSIRHSKTPDISPFQWFFSRPFLTVISCKRLLIFKAMLFGPKKGFAFLY